MQVGQKVWIQRTNNGLKSEGFLGEITKIGKKYVYVGDMRFFIDTLQKDAGVYASDYRLWLSKQDYEDNRELDKNYWELRGRLMDALELCESCVKVWTYNTVCDDCCDKQAEHYLNAKGTCHVRKKQYKHKLLAGDAVGYIVMIKEILKERFTLRWCYKLAWLLLFGFWSVRSGSYMPMLVFIAMEVID